MLRNLFVSILSVLALACPSAVYAQAITTHTFATLPGSPTAGQLAWLTDNSGTATEGSPAAGGAPAGNRDLVAYDATQTRWEFVLRLPATAPEAGLETYLEAIRVGYDNSTSGATAEDVQAALDELFASPGGGGGGDLGTTATGSALTITNTGGTPASIPAATTTTWGALTDEDKVKLDGIEAGATADQNSAEVPFTSTITGWVASTVRAALDELFSLGGSGNLDADRNGLFERAGIMDGDGDGSTWVTCTAKDAPLPQCKVAGERIYPDLSDDVNCMIRGCGARPRVMEHSGEIALTAGVFVNFGCWRPGGTNDPSVPTTHDSTGDAAFADCPLGENGLRQTTLSLAGWGGTISGVGQAPRRTDTASLVARGYGRTDATYIVNDLGNAEDTWFVNTTNQSKTLGFGYPLQDVSVLRYGVAAWHPVGSAPGGWGTIESATGASQDVKTLTTATLCVCTDGAACTSSGDGGTAFGIQSITTGTPLLVEHDVKSSSTRTATSIVTARSAPPYVQGSCTTGHVGVPIGIAFNGATGVGVLPAVIEDIIDNAGQLYILRPDYFASGAQVRNLTLEPQDWWNEAGGDCADSGTWATASFTSTDPDCDTWHLATVHGLNYRTPIRDVSFRYWHWYAIDGEGTPTFSVPQFEGVDFIYGNGGAVADPGHGWRLRDVRVSHTRFSGFVIENFGVNTRTEDLLIQNSAFPTITTFTNSNSVSILGTRIENSEFSSAYGVGCGNSNLSIDDVYATGRFAAPTGFAMEGLVSINCSTTTNPNSNTYLSRLREDPPGSSVRGGGTYAEGAGQVLVRLKIDDKDNWESLGRILITDSRVYDDVEPASGDPFFAHDEEGCLVGIEDRNSAGGSAVDGLSGSDGSGAGELDTLRYVKLLGNSVRGHLFCVFGGQGMWDDINQCADQNSTGGPPQVGGPPDDLCDIDGTTPVVLHQSESALFNAHWTQSLENNFEYP